MKHVRTALIVIVALVLRQSKYDLVLLDQMMPGLSGTETLHLMRRGRLADSTPVIALTADAVVGAKESYLAPGFTDYLSKPIKFEELEAALKKHLPPALQTTQDELAHDRRAAGYADGGGTGGRALQARRGRYRDGLRERKAHAARHGGRELNELNLRRQRNA